MRPSSAPEVFVFLLLDGLSLMSLASAVEPLRSLNRLLGHEAYQWRMASLDGGAVAASNGIEIAACPLNETLERADVLLACGGLRIRIANERRHLIALRNAARAGITLGALSTGSWLLARAGLLSGYRCTIHWENRPAFMEQFPDLQCTDRIYEIDRNRMTCSGGTAAMDLMLHLISERHGRELATRVANQFHHERIRDAHDGQRGGALDRMRVLPPLLQGVIRRMQDHIEEPLSVAELADGAGITARQLERLFRRYMKSGPARAYLSLRVDRARELILYSDLPILDVAIATGFASTSHFSQWFRRLHGVRPSSLRSRDARAA